MTSQSQPALAESQFAEADLARSLERINSPSLFGMGNSLPIVLTGLGEKVCLVIGGGDVAERKTRALLDAGARVRVIAPDLTVPLAEFVQRGQVDWVARQYSRGDLEGAFLVIAATDDPEVNAAAAREAAERGCLVNVVDDPALCNFIAPAVVRRGDLTIAISTGGLAPALSGHLRARLEQEFGPEWEGYVNLLAGLREQIAACFPDLEERRRAWQRMLHADLLAQLLAEGDQGARASAQALLFRE
jgi:precorrin-2 dehydrogenase/sirohydrochlorin ferrochelatase